MVGWFAVGLLLGCLNVCLLVCCYLVCVVLFDCLVWCFYCLRIFCFVWWFLYCLCLDAVWVLAVLNCLVVGAWMLLYLHNSVAAI